MKKLLALVLAMVMTLGLATVGASAATVKYADKNDIDYQEAADVLSKVGVFEGKGENFAPKDNLNRAEAAKLIAYLMLGTKTAEAIKGNGNRFSDVPADHWACGYIEYLASAGVVSGVGGGNFNPNGQVTAVQFAKMLNVALGYDAQVEGYVGESWNINIMKQANDDKIFDALEIGSNDVLTREQAAQMCLNALKADVVEYESKGDTLTINNSTVVLNAKKAKDKVSNDSGKATKVKNDPVVGGYTLQLGEDRYNGDLEMVDTRDDFGRPASEWRYKTEKIGTYVKRGDIKHTYTDEVKRGPLYDVLGKAIYDDLVDNKALLYYFEDGVPFDGNLGMVNNFDSKATNKTEIEKFVQKNGDKAINAGNSTGNGTLTEVFVNDDHNVITISVINTYAYKASSDYRASTEDIVVAPVETAKINLDSTRLTLEDFPEIKDLKKDDYILITAHQNTNSNNYEAKSAVKAEVLTAKVDKYIYDDNVTLDGNVTKYSKKAAGDSKITEYSVGQETTVVLDKYGYIIYVDEAVVSNNYVFISELYQGSGSSTSKVKANAYFVDGTNSEITVKEISGLSSLTKEDMAKKQGSLGGAETTIGVVKNDRYAGWYTYNKNSSSEYTLNAVPTNSRLANGFSKTTTIGELTKSDTVAFINNTAKALTKDSKTNADGTFYQLNGKDANTIKANDKTVMVVTYAENNDVDIYTGVKNLPDITLNNADATRGQGKGVIFVVNDTSSYARFVFVSLQGNWSVYGTENESLLYIIKTDKKNVVSSDTTYYTYKALDENAKEIKVEGDGSNVFGSAEYTAFYKTSKNASGRYTRGSAVPNSTAQSPAKYINTTTNTTTYKSSTTGYGIAADNGALTIAGDSFTLDNNYKLVVVSKANALNKLKDTDYEASVVTADGLAAMVKGYDVEYYMQAKLKDNYVKGQGGKIIEAYVTITSAVANGNASSGSTTASGILKLMLPADLLKSDPVKVYYAGSNAPTGQQVSDALASELLGTGYSIKKMAYDSTNTNYVFDLENASGATFEKALRYDWDNMTYDAQQNKLVASAKVSTIKSVGLSGTATATDSTKFAANEVLFVGKNNSLVIPENVTLTVKEAYIDGTVTVQDGGKLTIGGGTEQELADMIITKSGHVTVKAGGTLNATTADVDVEYGSTSLENAGTTTIGTLNANGRVASTGGSFEVKNTATFGNGGTLTVSGGNFKAQEIKVNTGASMAASGTANVDATNGTKVASGASLTVSGDSYMSGMTEIKSGSTVAVSDTAKIDQIKSNSGTVNITVDGQTKPITQSAVSAGDVKFLLTVTPTDPTTDDGFAITGTSLSQKEKNVYYLSQDATTFSITLKNTKTYEKNEIAETTFDITLSAVKSSETEQVNNSSNYSLSQNSVTLAKDGTATITVSNSKGVNENVTIKIKAHEEQPSSSGKN